MVPITIGFQSPLSSVLSLYIFSQKIFFFHLIFFRDQLITSKYFRESEKMEEEEEQGAAQHLSSAGQTLPELTNELLSAHTSQFSEIEQKEALLEQLEAELAAVQEQLLAVRGEVDAVVRSICLNEDLLASLGRQCGELEGEVVALVLEREQLQYSHSNAIKGEMLEEKLRESYGERMKLHQARTMELERLSPKEKELESLKEKISSVKLKSKHLLTHIHTMLELLKM